MDERRSKEEGIDMKDDAGIAKQEPHWRTQRDHLYYKMVKWIEATLGGELNEYTGVQIILEHEKIEDMIHG